MKLKHIALAALMATASAASAEVKIALDGAPDPEVSGTYNWVMGFSEVLDKAPTNTPGVGALRLRLVATKGDTLVLRGEDGKYLPHVLLDLDYWVLMPT